MKTLFTFSLLSFFFFISCEDDIFFQDTISKSISKSDSISVTLKQGESISINQELVISFDSVPTDSRCPLDAMCVWAGDGEVKLGLKRNNISTSISLHTTLSPKVALIDNYEIHLINLSPLRKAIGNIEQAQYSAELRIKYLNPDFPKPVYIIDSSSEGLIHKDNLVVSDVLLEKDLLTLSVSYSGGYKEHSISLFAYSGIMKSNPPQMSLVVSHDANNDMCEAYATIKTKLDLRNLKEYLNAMGSYDKTILSISGTDGKPIKQSPLVYYLK